MQSQSNGFKISKLSKRSGRRHVINSSHISEASSKYKVSDGGNQSVKRHQELREQ